MLINNFLSKLLPLSLFMLITSTFYCYAEAQKLTVSIMPSTGAQRSAYHQLIDKFKTAHPQVQVQLFTYKQEDYKSQIETILEPSMNNGDLFFWFGGSRLSRLQELGYLLDLTPWWEKGNWQKTFSQAAEQSVTVNNAKLALPINYYQWGFYYRPSKLITQNNTFSNWNNFINTCRLLDRQGSNLVTIGSQSTWSVAAWFDYLNLRINGIDFHHNVTQGKISFSDPKINKVFQYWQQAIDANCFTPKRSELTWKQALPELYHQKAQSILMGNFFTLTLPKRIKNDLEFAAFPTIIPEIPRYEEAPMDVIVASINAKNNPAAFTFLNFLATTDALSELNRKIHKINPFEHSTESHDPFLNEGMKLLSSAEGITQFFDRDALAVFSVPAMEIFANFINGKISIDVAQTQLETLRMKVFPAQLKNN